MKLVYKATGLEFQKCEFEYRSKAGSLSNSPHGGAWFVCICLQNEARRQASIWPYIEQAVWFRSILCLFPELDGMCHMFVLELVTSVFRLAMSRHWRYEYLSEDGLWRLVSSLPVDGNFPASWQIAGCGGASAQRRGRKPPQAQKARTCYSSNLVGAGVTRPRRKG